MCNESKRSNQRIIKAVDFFCGAGGATRGFLDAGIDIVCGIDNDSKVSKTYEKNNRSYCNSFTSSWMYQIQATNPDASWPAIH